MKNEKAKRPIVPALPGVVGTIPDLLPWVCLWYFPFATGTPKTHIYLTSPHLLVNKSDTPTGCGSLKDKGWAILISVSLMSATQTIYCCLLNESKEEKEDIKGGVQ